jgi:acyl-CoA dehydrogenase
MILFDSILLPAEAEAFRAEVRQFLAQELDDELREPADAAESFLTGFAERDIARRWQNKLLERRWLGPKIPRDLGGPSWTPLEHYIFEIESGLAGAPFLPAMGLQYVAPVLAKFGTAEQQEAFIPRILSCEHYWCQGFSEPESGSDLASLKCAARREGNDYVVEGSKIWTTQAHQADHIFCLVRTSRGDRPQQGISFLLVDMRQPGVTVRPIKLIGGNHDLNQVFFDSARAPTSNLIGAEGDGWNIAKYLLELERGGFIWSSRCEHELRRLKAVLQREREIGGPILEADRLGNRIDELDLAILQLSHLELKSCLGQQRGFLQQAQAHFMKILGADLLQSIDQVRVDVLGPWAAYYRAERPRRSRGETIAGRDYLEPLMPKMLNNHGLSIEGGTNEIQRNLIARELFS